MGIFKCNHNWEIVKRSNVIQQDEMGYPLRLFICKCSKCGEVNHQWIDVNESELKELKTDKSVLLKCSDVNLVEKKKSTGFIKQMQNMFDSVINVNNINVNIAKTNHQKYNQKYIGKQKHRLKKYLKSLCKQIKMSSKIGLTSIDTKTCDGFKAETKEYFEQRGFNVQENSDYSSYFISRRGSYLTISWE